MAKQLKKWNNRLNGGCALSWHFLKSICNEWCTICFINYEMNTLFSEHEAIWFLKSCYYSNENAKTSIDSYFTIRTLSPELFKKRDNNSETFNANFKVAYVLFTSIRMKKYNNFSLDVSQNFPRKHTKDIQFFSSSSLIQVPNIFLWMTSSKCLIWL